MKKFIKRLLPFILFLGVVLLQIPSMSIASTTSPYIVVGSLSYQTTWTANNIDASKLTHIKYVSMVNIVDGIAVLNGLDIDPNKFASLRVLKQRNPGLKTLLSIGGTNWASALRDVALTSASRAAFADSAVSLMKANDFDGLDIDYQWLTDIEDPNNWPNKINFTALMQVIREKIDAQGVADGVHYLLTISSGPDWWYANSVELGNLHPLVDFFNIMTYDFGLIWSTDTMHHTSLYDPTTQNHYFCIDQTLKIYGCWSVPHNKMVISCALYGRGWFGVNNANNGLYQTFTGQSGIGIAYTDLAAYYINKSWIRYWDDQAKAAYLWNPTTNAFISYDDEQSVREKAAYIKSQGLAGAMLWEYTQDANGVLVNALFNKLNDNNNPPAPAVLNVNMNPNAGNYTLTATVPANSGATSVNIYETPFTTPVKTQVIIPNATTNTIVTYTVTNKPTGVYPYLVATVNANGETIGSNITVYVQSPLWAPNTAYNVGKMVTYDGKTYKCIQAHTSLVGWEPPNVPALWQIPGSSSSAWMANAAYNAGDHVTYGGNTYKCTQAHTSQVGWEPPNVPALWQLL